MMSSCIFYNLCGLLRWLPDFAAQSLEQEKPEHEIQADHQFVPGRTWKGCSLRMLGRQSGRGRSLYFQ
jgi:hypothetical protein